MHVASSLPWSHPCLEQGFCPSCWVVLGCSLLQKKCPVWSMFLAVHVPSEQDSPHPLHGVQPGVGVHGSVLPCKAAGPGAGQGWCCRGCSSRMCGPGGSPQSFWVVWIWDLIPGIRLGAFFRIQAGRPSTMPTLQGVSPGAFLWQGHVPPRALCCGSACAAQL